MLCAGWIQAKQPPGHEDELLTQVPEQDRNHNLLVCGAAQYLCAMVAALQVIQECHYSNIVKVHIQLQRVTISLSYNILEKARNTMFPYHCLYYMILTLYIVR